MQKVFIFWLNYVLVLSYQSSYREIQYHLIVSFILLLAEYVDATPRSSQLL
jgi:hypothetical protein